eukprot:CAMPEP_0201608508 /NCGR_PEP_ID=MMETSP0492-20130828/7629_1 /ASSEMBLY_ACC=CAM_ASM_000837 /TAXON_ID=420259 /ORGANISM="Thalassiosira gravida, Strain GMp14c1" /LENGTH=138 /DNA_ID=CAMNT_0048073321 /DNA_START=206 /DNA_END=623 /DNA_ORIENTATION=+
MTKAIHQRMAQAFHETPSRRSIMPAQREPSKRQHASPNTTPGHQQASPSTPPATARNGATTADRAATPSANSAGAPQHTTIASRGCTGDDGELKGCRGTTAQRVASARDQDTTGKRGRKRRWGSSDIDPPHLRIHFFE